MTKHIAVFTFPGYGHVNPTLEVTRCLIEMGHRVSYVVDERLAAGPKEVGAEVVGYPSRRTRLAAGPVTGEDVGALALGLVRESRDVVLPLALEAFQEDVPDLILYDLESFFAARIAAKKWNRPKVQLFPCVASNEKFSMPAESFEGADEHAMETINLVTEYLSGQGEEMDAIWSFMSIHDERNIVLLPREFQPLGETFDDRYTFVGHSLPTDRPGTGSWSAPGDGPSVLITLGTEVNDRPDFFETCGTAFADGGWHVVMTVGPGNLPEVRPATGNVETHEWLKFSTLLPHVDAVVCHGGISTMLESFYFGKPVVMVTYTPEDKINGRQIDQLGLGRSLAGEDVTAERLRSLVEEVANDPGIRQRVARMRMKMLSEGGPSRAALLIDDWLCEQPEPTHGEAMTHSDRHTVPDTPDSP